MRPSQPVRQRCAFLNQRLCSFFFRSALFVLRFGTATHFTPLGHDRLIASTVGHYRRAAPGDRRVRGATTGALRLRARRWMMLATVVGRQAIGGTLVGRQTDLQIVLCQYNSFAARPQPEERAPHWPAS